MKNDKQFVVVVAAKSKDANLRRTLITKAKYYVIPSIFNKNA